VITRQKEDTLSFKFSAYQTLHQAIQWRVIKKMVERIYDQRRVMEDGGWLEVNKIYKKLCQPSPSFHLELPHDVFVENDMTLLIWEGGEVQPHRLKLNSFPQVIHLSKRSAKKW